MPPKDVLSAAALVGLVAGCNGSDARSSPSLSLTRWWGAPSAAEPAPSASAQAAAPKAPVLPPLVGLSGETREMEDLGKPGSPRAYARAFRTWVHEAAS